MELACPLMVKWRVTWRFRVRLNAGLTTIAIVNQAVLWAVWIWMIRALDSLPFQGCFVVNQGRLPIESRLSAIVCWNGGVGPWNIIFA